MTGQRIKTTLRLAFGAIAIMAAYGGGVTSGDLLLAHLTNEVDLRRTELRLERERADSNRTLARQQLAMALLEARFAQMMRDVRSSDDLPPDRVRALRDRLREGVHERQLRGTKAAVRERPVSGS